MVYDLYVSLMKTALLTSISAATIVALASCHHDHGADRSPDVPDSEEIAETVVAVTEDFTRDSTFTFGRVEVPVREFARVYPTEHEDVYMSIRVFALQEDSGVNIQLARIIGENFAEVAGGDVGYDRDNGSAAAVEREIDFYGNIFTNDILPALKESVSYGYYVVMELRPAWSDGEKVITYMSYNESCGGGACDTDASYVSFALPEGRPLDFEQLVPADKRRQVRDELLSLMASDAGRSRDNYLKWLGDFINPGSSEAFTSDDFPLGRCAVMGDSLVFSYRQGEIAYPSRGCPVFLVKRP